jgi:hypothetical protein
MLGSTPRDTTPIQVSRVWQEAPVRFCRAYRGCGCEHERGMDLRGSQGQCPFLRWEVYDRQLGRSLDRAYDLDEFIGRYADMPAGLHRMFPEALRRPAHPVGDGHQRKDDQRRSWTYRQVSRMITNMCAARLEPSQQLHRLRGPRRGGTAGEYSNPTVRQRPHMTKTDL